MNKVLFSADKTVYKANLHCHTTVTDGEYTPEETKKNYMANGYGIVAYTDHRVLCGYSYLNDENFLALHGCEMDIKNKMSKMPGYKNYKYKQYHFNLIATDENITHTPPMPSMDYDDIDAINQYIKDRSDEGFLVCYNHPYWSMQTSLDFGELRGCFAMEIYNHSCEMYGYYGYNPQAYDEMLRTGHKLYCVSADDNHNANITRRKQIQNALFNADFDSFGGFTMINSDSLKYRDVINALKQGDFYASQGPEIYKISLYSNVLSVACSDVTQMVIYNDGIDCWVKSGQIFNNAEFTLKGDEKYIRVTCRDVNHKDANSVAYWL